jgi:hypothetical protein
VIHGTLLIRLDCLFGRLSIPQALRAAGRARHRHIQPSPIRGQETS